MNLKKGMMAGLAVLTLSMSAQASEINVGGVVWDPDEIYSYPYENDFNAHGAITEEGATTPGDVVNGYGIFGRLNSLLSANVDDFCPSCELTFTFSMELVAFIPNGFQPGPGVNGSFEFTNLVIDIFVDDRNYADTEASAGNGSLWLRLTSDLLSGENKMILLMLIFEYFLFST